MNQDASYISRSSVEVTINSAFYIVMMRAVLEKGKPFRFTAPGYSMTPFIRDHDIITISRIDDAVRLGDAVAFINPDTEKLTVHRVIQVRPDGFLIKGDNTPYPDGVVPMANIIGRVVRVEHKGKEIRLGLGFEKKVIAFLSRLGWLSPMVCATWRYFLRPIMKRNTI